MSEKQILIFGAGYSGKAFARASKDAGTILGTTRATEKFEALRQAGIQPLLFDGALTLEISDALEKTTHLVVSVAPEEAGDPVLNAARQTIAAKMPALEWIAYLSTVGVYGDHGGGWVDETAECRPVSERSMLRVAAEQDWLKLGRDIGRPVAILRLSGIYGPGRNALVNLENGTARRLIKPGQVFNRIHCDDIAGALWHLLKDNPRRHLQRHRRPAGAAAGRRHLCRRADGRHTAAGNSVRDRPTFAHGAVLLWREQACRQHGDQGGRLSLPLSRLPQGIRPYVGRGQLARRRGAQPDEAVVIEIARRACYDSS